MKLIQTVFIVLEFLNIIFYAHNTGKGTFTEQRTVIGSVGALLISIVLLLAVILYWDV